MRRTSDRRWLHPDERGSILAVSDGSGNLVGTVNRYDEYGAPQGTLTGRFGFTAQAWLPEVGLSYYRARMYNPSLGRFMQADPIGYDSGINLYAYVLGDPVNFTDPSGLQRRGGSSGGGGASGSWGPSGSRGSRGSRGGGGSFGGGGASGSWGPAAPRSRPSTPTTSRRETAAPVTAVTTRRDTAARPTPADRGGAVTKPSAESTGRGPVYAHTKDKPFTTDESAMVRDLFGKNENVLNLIEKMKDPNFVPPQVDANFLQKYIDFVDKLEGAKDNYIAELRREAAEMLLKFLKSKTKDEAPKGEEKGKGK